MTSPLSSFSSAKPLPALSQRYARALYDLAKERGQMDMVEGDIKSFQAMLKESADLRRFIANPLTQRKLISAALEKLFEDAKFSGLTRHFFHVTIANGRARDLPAIITAFFAALAASRGIVTADVVTANPLSDTQATELKTALIDALKAHGVKDVELNARADKDVLGGLSVQVGAWMYNGTLKHRLQELGRYLKHS